MLLLVQAGTCSGIKLCLCKQKHLPVAGAGSGRDAAEVFLLRSAQPAELSGQVGRVTTLLEKLTRLAWA